MKYYGNVEMQQNLLVEAVIPLDKNFPVKPVVGQLVFTDNVLYICVQIVNNLPYWVPLTNQITSYTYYQGTPSASWSVDHPLNTANVNVTVYDTQNRVVIPNEITVNNATNVQIDFGAPFTGTALILSGTQDGTVAPTYAYEFFQTTPSTTWTITHNLSRYPMVRIFVGNQEVQPQSVTFNTLNTVTLTFSEAQVGQAKLI